MVRRTKREEGRKAEEEEKGDASFLETVVFHHQLSGYALLPVRHSS